VNWTGYREKRQEKTVCLLTSSSFAHWFLPSVFCLLLPCLGRAASFTASVDRTEVSVGGQVQLTLRFEDVPNVGQPPQLPVMDGFNTGYGGAQTQTRIENGVRHDSVSHIFVLTPTREGMLGIPVFNVQLGAQILGSQPITIRVTEVQIQGGNDDSIFTQGVSTNDIFQIRLSLPRTRLFLNEMVPLDLKLYVRNGVRYRSQTPAIASAGFSEIRLPRPVESQEVVNGKSFAVYTFRALTSPLQLGRLALGPAQVTMDVLVEPSRRPHLPGFNNPFFEKLFNTGTNKLTATSQSVPVQVQPLPDDGKPMDFTGAVGRFALDATAHPTTTRAGEPIALTIRVVGQGNIATLALPKFTPPKGFKSYEPVVRSKQNDEMGFTGEKVFEQVIVPLSPRASLIPSVTFSFFDPELGRYQTVSRGPIQLTVRDAPTGAAPVVIGVAPTVAPRRLPEKLGVGLIYLKPDLGKPASASVSLYCQTWFLATQGAPLLALVASWVAQRRREWLRCNIHYSRARRAYGNAQHRLAEAERLMLAGQSQSAEFYAVLFKTLQDYLGDRLNLPSSGITSDVVDDQLRPTAVSPEICQTLKDVFTACDTARFSPAMQDNRDRKQLVKTVHEVIAAMERMSPAKKMTSGN
jgi:hypothetical protein